MYLIFEGVSIEKKYLEIERCHHYSINLKCENGLGNIVLFESNGCYWIFLEARNYDYDVMFIRDDIRFTKIQDIDEVVNEMIEHITE